MTSYYTATRKSETWVVKEALRRAGYQNVHVGHGTGTGVGWLHIKADYKPGQSWQVKNQDILRIAQMVTGRTGDYGGRINIS